MITAGNLTPVLFCTVLIYLNVCVQLAQLMLMWVCIHPSIHVMCSCNVWLLVTKGLSFTWPHSISSDKTQGNLNYEEYPSAFNFEMPANTKKPTTTVCVATIECWLALHYQGFIQKICNCTWSEQWVWHIFPHILNHAALWQMPRSVWASSSPMNSNVLFRCILNPIGCGETTCTVVPLCDGVPSWCLSVMLNLPVIGLHTAHYHHLG